MHCIPQLLLVLLAQDALPRPEAAKPARTFTGHTADVYDVVFSSDGSMLATASFDSSVRLWRVADGKELASYTGHKGRVLAIAFSPDDRTLLSGSEDRTLRLWNLPQTKANRIPGHEAPVEALRLTADGGILISAAQDGTVRLWDRAAAKELLRLEGGGAAIRAVAVDPAETSVAAGGDDKVVRVWSIAHLTAPPPPVAKDGTAQLVPEGASWRYLKGRAAAPRDWNLPGFDASDWDSGASGFGYSSKAEELSTVKTRIDDMRGQGGYLSLFIRHTFRLGSPERVKRLLLRVLHDDGFVAYLNGKEVGRANVGGQHPAFNTSARQAGEPTSLDVDLTPYLQNLKAGDNVLALQGHNASVSSSDFVLTPSLSAVLRPPQATKAAGLSATLAGSRGTIRALAFHPDGSELAAGGDDETIHVWKWKDSRDVKKLHAGTVVHGLAFVDPGTLIAAGGDGSIKIWDLREGRVTRVLEGHSGPVRALALRDRAQLASGGADGTVRLWDVTSGEQVQRLSGHDGPVLSLAYTADGQTLVSGGADNTLRAWKTESGSEVTHFSSRSAVRAVQAHGEHYYAAAEGTGILHWPVPSAMRTFTGHEGVVQSVLISPDGATAASASSDKTIRLWNLGDGKQVRRIVAHISSVYCLAYSPDGERLASGGFDGAVKIWKTRDGSEVKSLDGHEEGIFCLVYSPDGKFLFSASSDRTILQWSLDNGKKVAVYRGHPDWICGLALAPDRGAFFSVDRAGHLISWSVAEAEPLEHRKLPAMVYDLALSPDGNWLATANKGNSAFLLETE